MKTKIENARDLFLGLIEDNRTGIAKGIYSVCTANAEVLEACFSQAKADDSLLLIESTSNQVDQLADTQG